MLPRVDAALDDPLHLHELRTPFHVERPVIERLVAKPEGKAFFRRTVLQAYDESCAVTGWKLITATLFDCDSGAGAGHPPRLASAP